MVRGLALWGPVAACMAVIWLASAQSSLPGLENLWDKPLHAAAYLVLGLLCLRATHGGWRPLRGPRALAGCLVAWAYGGSDEWHQAWVAGRDPSLADWVADGVGVLVAVPLFHGITILRRARRAAD